MSTSLILSGKKANGFDSATLGNITTCYTNYYAHLFVAHPLDDKGTHAHVARALGVSHLLLSNHHNR